MLIFIVFSPLIIFLGDTPVYAYIIIHLIILQMMHIFFIPKGIVNKTMLK